MIEAKLRSAPEGQVSLVSVGFQVNRVDQNVKKIF